MTGDHHLETIRIARKGQPQPSARRLGLIATAGAAALSLVLATAIPARAGNKGDDIAKALIAALVIGALVHEAQKDKVAPPPPAPPEPVRKKKKDKAPRIPAVCALEFEGAERSVTVYPESCLLDEGVTHRLPRHCAKEARIYGEWDRVYGERCLREAGFRLPGDHRTY